VDSYWWSGISCFVAIGSDAKKVIINVSRVSWLDVYSDLRSTFDNDEAEIKADVDSGKAMCWRIGDTAMIARKDDNELVVMCLAGKNLKDILPSLKVAAKKGGCESIRFYTKRPALGRLLSEFGFTLDYSIFRVSL
jgi:hypothetical protein